VNEGRYDDLRGEGWGRLLAAARRKLEANGGQLIGNIGVSAPTDIERRVVIGLTGRHRNPDVRRLTVSLPDLDAALHRAHGMGLVEALTTVTGPVRDRRGERQAEAEAREVVLTTAREGRHRDSPWFAAWLEEIAADGTVTRLLRRDAAFLLTQATAVLDRLPAADVPLPVLAEQTTGDPKALGPTPLATLVLRALALRQGMSAPLRAEDRRILWDTVGVIVDDLASQVLVLNLPGEGSLLGDWLSAAAEAGVPFRVTLHQLTTLPFAVRVREVFVCENPAILRRSAAELGPGGAPLVCTEGVPSAACNRLIAAVRDAGAVVHWRNDFDWPGLRMTAAAINRFESTLWRMSAADYLAALDAGESDRLAGAPAASPWDERLSIEMSRAGRTVMEERLMAVLLEDLAHVSGERD